MKKEKSLFDNLILICLISMLFLLFFSTSTSPLYKDYQDDSAIFITVGKMLKDGKVLYKDIFDHKGPVFFFIEYIGQPQRQSFIFSHFLSLTFRESLCFLNIFELCHIFYLTGSKNVSGLFGLKISLQYITVTRSSESLRFIILCVYFILFTFFPTIEQ